MIASTPPAIVLQSEKANFAQNYGNLIAQQVKVAQNDIAAYQNKAPSAAGTVRYGKVLTIANFFPVLPGTKSSTGRNGVVPSYIDLARAAPANSTIEAGAFLPTINSFINLPNSNICPHIIVSYSGDIVQLVDLGDTANYLQLGSSKPPPNPINPTPEGLIDGIIELTSSFETIGNPYTSFNPNDAGHGASFGFIQFNQQRGGLYNLLVLMNQMNSTLFSSIFGNAAASLLDQGTLVSMNLSSLRAQFITAGLQPVFQQAQRILARQQYFDTVKPYAETFNLTTQRAYAILFDTNVQGGTAHIQKFAHAALSQLTNLGITASNPGYEKQFLTLFATYADTMNGSNNRRTRLLATPALSDGPLLTLTPSSSNSGAQSSVTVSDESCVHIVLEGRYGDPVTAPMMLSLAKIAQYIGQGMQIPIPSRLVSWTNWDRSLFPADPTMGNFPFADLFSQILSPTALPGSNPIFVLPEQLLSRVTANTVSSLLVSLQRAKTRGKKNYVLQAYDSTKAISRAQQFSAQTRGGCYDAAVTAAQNSSNVSAASASSTITNANQAITPEDANPGQANTIGLLFDFTTGLWSDGKAGGKIANG